MGCAASSTAGTTVVEADQVVVQFGADGMPVLRPAAATTTAAGRVMVVVDPRGVDGLVKVKEWAAALSEDVRAKTTPFLLLPSTTSSAAAMLHAEVALQCLAVVKAMGDGMMQRVCVVRVDDWMQGGDAILRAMASAGKRVYPAEEAEAIANLWMPDASIDNKKRFETSVYNFRAWCHAALGSGAIAMEADIMETLDALGVLLADASLRLPRLSVANSCDAGLAPPPPGQGLMTSNCAPQLLAFSADSAAKLAAAGAIGVDVVDAAALTSKSLPVYTGATYPVCFLLPEDLSPTWTQDNDGSPALQFCMNFYDDMIAAGLEDANIVVVLVATSRDAFIQAGYDMVNAFRIFIESSVITCTIMVTEEQVPAACGLFTHTSIAKEHIARHLGLCAPFPRLSFFSLVVPAKSGNPLTTLGEPIADGDLSLPALTVGPTDGILGGNRLFKGTKDKFVPFLLRGCPGERIIPGAHGFTGVSVVWSGQRLFKLLDDLLSQTADPASDDFMALEAVSNVTDLRSELEIYSSANAEEDE